MAPSVGFGVGLAFALGVSTAPAGAGTLAFSFGALTRANAGAAAPVDASFGDTGLVPVAATIVNADPVNPGHWAVVGGYKLAPTINGGLAASYALKVSYDGVVYDVSINTLPGAFSAASVAEAQSAFTLAVATPAVNADVYFRNGTFGALAVTNIAMSGTLTGIPPAPACFDDPLSYRAQNWTPDFTGGRIRIKSHNPFKAIFSGGSTHTNSTAIIWDDITVGRIASYAQYSYEPEATTNITAITLGNPTIVTVANAAGIAVASKQDIKAIAAGGPTALNATHDVLAVSGNQITINFDSTALTPWVSGGTMNGASKIDTVAAAWTPGGSQSTFIFSARISCKDINPDAAWWGSGVAQGPHKQGVFYNITGDGANTFISIGRGYQNWVKNLNLRNALQDYVPIRSTTATSATPHNAPKLITGISNANPCVVTCVAHGLAVDDVVVISGVVGATQANNNGNSATVNDHMWGVYQVIDADHFVIGKLRMGNAYGSIGMDPADSTAWGAYTSGGQMNGPLWYSVFIENLYVGPQASDPRFTAIHSDGLQQGSPNNEINQRGCMFDVFSAPIAGLTSSNSTQGFLGGGAEIDSTRKKMVIRNFATITTTINGIIPMITKDWWSDFRYTMSLHWATTLFPTLGATFKASARKNLNGGILCGDFVNQGGGIVTGMKQTLLPTFDLRTAFAGNFQQDGRGYWYDADPEPTGTVPQILQAYANRYKGIGTYANLGFGADPGSPFFTGTVDNTPAVVSGVTVTADAFGAQIAWSEDQAVGFAYGVLTTDATPSFTTADEVINAAKFGGSGVLSQSVLGLSASGAQAPFVFTSLSPTTAYKGYIVVERLQGAKTLVGPIAVNTVAISGVPITQAVNIETTSATYGAQQVMSGQINISNAANRALVVIACFEASADSADTSGINFTFGAVGRALNTGTVVTLLDQLHGTGPKRARVIIAALLNPPSGLGTVQIMCPGTVPVATACWAVEVANAKQNLANWIYGGTGKAGGSTNVTARQGTLTPSAANSLHLGGICIQSGDYRAQITATDGATLVDSRNTGTSGFSDVTAALLSEVLPTAGVANTIGASWTTAQIAGISSVIIPPEV